MTAPQALDLLEARVGAHCRRMLDEAEHANATECHELRFAAVTTAASMELVLRMIAQVRTQL